MEKAIQRAVAAFALPEGAVTAEPFGNGHINRTYVVSLEGRAQRYILQQINHHVFLHPDQVQENILAVTEHLRRKILLDGGDPDRETLRVIPARDGKLSFTDDGGNWWRLFPMIENTFSLDLPDTPETFENCGRAFGLFQRRLDDFPAESLHETIPHFHDTPWRMEQLKKAARADRMGRLKEAREELEFCLAQESWAGRLMEGLRAGTLPLRVTHNDTKLNNVMMDAATGEPVCVVDLDTVMPGLVACDYGEAIRTGASTAPEDERDLGRIGLSLPLTRAYTRGFLRALGNTLSREEILSLPWGARTMMLEDGVRFLTDYLDGDRYFAVHRPRHNLERARAQLTLLRRTLERWEEMLAAVEDPETDPAAPQE